ncbi:toxin C-terminal domain-containing protein [Nocardioides limicola]|uniref:toxin C-terminal domain-containing protein n=1 Tax=Nocardioides limicola TaxID=2803368 RepID=UPI00193C190C|nr:toxin C-terminal domain-containing protein [Nocardioides sp. DJM-14]
MARRVGCKPTTFIMRGQKVFTNRKNYIVQDTTSHSGGLWKMARSGDGLSGRKTRMGTYDHNLERIGP